MRIRREDVEAVRERARIADVVGEHVTLKSAGVGSMKGLCPFHDEKSPSFHVRPQVGLWHCFGCSEGGDVIDFVQRIDHLTFTEAVERLAARVGVQLRYEDDAGGRASGRQERVGQRQRLVEAHRVAAQFYAEQLATSPDAGTGRQFLAERGFELQASAPFGVGYAPRPGEALLRHLRGRGFTEDELLASGLASRGQRGMSDRFRGRLLWPIRDLTGDVVGFGARRLYDDDFFSAKYLNTPETAIYKKSQVLYGVDLAKREIARNRQVVVVEGYTDVMACHLAGVPTAVATCGTAFGSDHIRVVRRLLGDDGTLGGQVVFTFDGDEAGQKAALRAFEEDQRFVAQTFIAVAGGGMDPCELRQQRGDAAVRDLVAARQPLFEFAIRTAIARCDLDTAEGRVQGLRLAAPLVARIRDTALRPEYARQVAGWLGMEVEPVVAAVNRTARSGERPDQARRRRPGPEPDAAPEPARLAEPDGRDPVVQRERVALGCMLQVPQLVPAADADALGDEAFSVPAHRAVHDAIRAAGGMAAALTLEPGAWVERVRQSSAEPVLPLVIRLSVLPLPVDQDDRLEWLSTSTVLGIAELELIRQIGRMRSRLQREEPEQVQQALTDLVAVERRLIAIRERRATA